MVTDLFTFMYQRFQTNRVNVFWLSKKHKQFLQISKISIELCYKTVSDKIDTTACQTIKIRIQNGFCLLLKNDWIDGPDLIVGSTVAMSTTSTKSSLKRFAEYWLQCRFSLTAKKIASLSIHFDFIASDQFITLFISKLQFYM